MADGYVAEVTYLQSGVSLINSPDHKKAIAFIHPLIAMLSTK